jgi:hypothetical protein
MTDTTSTSTERRSHPPLWLVEGLDVVEQRRPILIAVTIGVIVIGGLLAALAPGLVPPVPIVGAAVGLAALLLGLAVAIALDAADLRLRGPRHVGAAGGELVAVLPTAAEPDGAATLAGAVLEARAPGAPLLLGLAASGRDVRPTIAWTDALATALEAEGVSVLRIDLASGRSRTPGLLEVVRDGVKLASAVTFGPEPRLARLGAGEDLHAALGALSLLPGRLPRDLDVLLVALPMAASRPVVAAVRSLDHVLIVAQRDRTSRVELIAGLDALEAAGTRAQVALLDDRTAARLAPSKSAPEPDATPEPAEETATVEQAEADAQPDAANEPTQTLDEAAGSTAAEPLPERAPRVGAPQPDAVAPDATEPAAAEPAAPGTPGPRSGGAFGVGGAALTAAGVAASLEPTPSGSDAEGADQDVSQAELDLDSPGAGPPPAAEAPVAEAPRGGSSVAEAPVAEVPRAGSSVVEGPATEVPRAGSSVADAAEEPVPGEEERPGDATSVSEPASGRTTEPASEEPSEPPSAPDDGRPPETSRRRPVVVVHGAAEAAAIALVETPVVAPPTPESDHEVDGALPVGRGTPVGHDAARTYAPGAVELDPAPAVEPTTADHAPSAAEPDRDPGEVPDREPGEAPDPDRTDEIPALRLRDPISDADVEHDEMMRTTAQLSALLGDLEVADDEPSGDTP